MSTGKLATYDIQSTGTPINVYTVTTGKIASYIITLCNRNSTNVKVRFAECISNSSVATSEWIVYDETIPPNGSIDRYNRVLGSSYNIFVQSDTINVSVNVNGYEE